jgi:superfamily I DNA/RNA helicase
VHPQSIRLNSSQDEADYIADAIKQLQAGGYNLSEVAIIARKYKDLESINQTLQQRKIPISYERADNVLSQAHIGWIVTILDFVNSLNRQDIVSKDELLPKILSFPFWEIDPAEIYQISIQAYQNKKTWLEIMQLSQDEKVKQTSEFLISLAKQKAVVTLETLIDYVIRGRIDVDWSESE